jgi:DNA-directed RNA polymerase II subunit RPB4
MAEKGGKGYSQGKASGKGKDDGSGKSRKGRKVVFEDEDSLDGSLNMASGSGDKGETETPTGRGKGDKVSNGSSKAPPPLELRVELPENTNCIMDCEAEELLQGIQDQMVMLSADPTIKIPVSFDRGLLYAKSVGHYTNPKSVRRVLESLKEHGVTDGEMCIIANACPDSVAEVFALVPSFKGKKAKLREPLKEALTELAKLKKSI